MRAIHHIKTEFKDFLKEFEATPLKKTKYLQGFYRVRMIYTILNNIFKTQTLNMIIYLTSLN